MVVPICFRCGTVKSECECPFDEEFEERAAIREYDGQFDRAIAERLAAEDMMQIRTLEEELEDIEW